jgi:hypothetical protein
MAKAADTQNADPITWANPVQRIRCPDRSSAAHQGSGIGTIDAMGDLEEGIGIPDGVAGERANIMVMSAKLCPVVAVRVQSFPFGQLKGQRSIKAVKLHTSQAIFASSARLVNPAESDSITDFD